MAQDTIDDIEQRSIERVRGRMTEDAPSKGEDGVLCPFCDRPMRVRRTILGQLDEANDEGDRPHVDGVQMKCAGDDGCGFRPDFDVPISSDEYDEELEERGERLVDMGFTPEEGASIAERLDDLGYLVESEESDTEDNES